MIIEANALCRRLWKDESGVVLALTLVVFMTLFVLACSIYAVGENIRERIELQNGADAAAYSAAIVQADAISRIAAINKAMAWTYVQMCRRQMDYIEHRWLERVNNEYTQEEMARRAQYAVLMCGHAHFGPFRCKDWWIGDSSHRMQVLLNRNQWVSIGSVRSALAGFNFGQVVQNIEKDWGIINSMNKSEHTIMGTLSPRIMSTVRTTLAANVSPTFNDAAIGANGADIRFALIHSDNPEQDYFKVYDDEDGFLLGSRLQSSDMGTGHDTWFPSRPPTQGRPNWQRYRDYVQWGPSGGGNSLVAEWMSHVEGWTRMVPCRDEGVHWTGWIQPTYSTHWGGGGITAEIVRDRYFSTKSATLEPFQLTRSFFSKPGGLVVGVARKQNNPFQFVGAPGSTSIGIFGLLDAGTNRYAWAVSAARAGYFDGGRPGTPGNYNSTPDCWEQSDEGPGSKAKWISPASAWLMRPDLNLVQEDWDAIFMPIRRIWSERMPAWQPRSSARLTTESPQAGKWTSDSGADVLETLWSSTTWQSLGDPNNSRKLNSLASPEAPRGMTGRLSFPKGATIPVYH